MLRTLGWPRGSAAGGPKGPRNRNYKHDRYTAEVIAFALMMQRENGTSSRFWSSCRELPSGTEVFVELVPYFNLCIAPLTRLAACGAMRAGRCGS
jgi:hypothetical protein